MAEEAYEAELFIIQFRCKKCGNGFMLLKKSSIQTNSKQGYPHICNNLKCNSIEYLNKEYPYTIERIKGLPKSKLKNNDRE